MCQHLKVTNLHSVDTTHMYATKHQRRCAMMYVSGALLYSLVYFAMQVCLVQQNMHMHMHVV